MTIYQASAVEREAYLQGMQQFIDWLRVNPQVPTPRRGQIQLSTRGTDEETRADVDRFAELAGVEAQGGEFYEAALRFGPIKFFAVSIAEAWSEEDHRVRELGREAVDRERESAAAARAIATVRDMADEAVAS